MGLIIPVWSRNLLSPSKIHIFPKRKCIKMKLYSTHMRAHTHTYTQTYTVYTICSDAWELLASVGKALWDCVSSNSNKDCAGSFVPELKTPCWICTCLRWRKLQHAQGSQLRTAREIFPFYPNVMSLVKTAASNRRNDEERESSWHHAGSWGEWQKPAHSRRPSAPATALKCQIWWEMDSLVWSGELLYAAQTRQWWKVCVWGMQSVCSRL